MAIILVDFDGTCIPTLPAGGDIEGYDTGAERILNKLVSKGHKLVLWTARNNSPNNPYNIVSQEFNGKTSLEEAVDWFRSRNIPLYGINEVPGEVDKIGTGRKALGDFLIDDTAVSMPIKFVKVKYFSKLTDSMEEIDSFHVDWEILEKFLETLKLI